MNYLQMLQEARSRREGLCTSIRSAQTAEELDKLELDLRKVDIEIKDLEVKVQEEEA